MFVPGGRDSGLASRQDCTQFEDALRRLYALEVKLTDQVSGFDVCLNLCLICYSQGCLETPFERIYCHGKWTSNAKVCFTGETQYLQAINCFHSSCVDQVQVDIRELRQKWVLPRVERVTTNTYKLYQVREQLKRSKVSYLLMYLLSD